MGQCNFLHLWHQKLYRAFRFGTLWPISCSYPRHSQLTRHSLMLANGRIRQSLTALVVYGWLWKSPWIIYLWLYIYPFLHACVTKCQVPWCIAWLIFMSSAWHIHIGHNNKNKQVKYHWIIPNISTKHILCVKAICRKLLFRAWGPHPVNFCGPKTIWKYLHRNTLQIHQFCGVLSTYRSKFMKAPFLVARASSVKIIWFFTLLSPNSLGLMLFVCIWCDKK